MMPDRSPKFVRHPALWLALALASGILFSNFVDLDWRLSVLGSACCAGLAFAFRGTGPARAFLILAFMCLGATCCRIEQLRERSPNRIRTIYDNDAVVSGTPVEIEGVLTGAPEASIDGEFLTVRTDQLISKGESRDVSGIVRMFVPRAADDLVLDEQSQAPELKYGSRLLVSCALEREDEYLNPGVQTRREVLDRMGVDATCTVKSRLLIEHVADESVFIPLAWVYDARTRLIEELRDHLEERTAGVMIASLLGNKYFLDKDTSDLFRDGGTFHILVISGLHITFIGGILLWLVRRVTRRRWTQFAITAGVLWAYTLAVGADVPVVRASVMFTIFLLGYSLHRQGSLLNSLGVCAIVLLVRRPSELFDPSFQLTFVAVAAIVACAYPLLEKLRAIGAWSPTPAAPFPPVAPRWLVRFCETMYWNDAAWRIEQNRNIWTANIEKRPLASGRVRFWSQKLLRYFFEGLLVSAVVQIWMLPLSVWYFHRVSIAGILLNLWVGFWIAVESFAAVGGAAAASLGLLARGLYAIADAANWFLLLLPRTFSENGWSSFRSPAYHGPAALVYLVYFVPLLLLAIAIMRWNVFSVGSGACSNAPKKVAIGTAIAAMAVAAIVIGHPFSAPRADGRLHLDFLDVGQGDSMLVTFPNGETLLVDGGGRQDYFRDPTGDGEASSFRPDHQTIGESVVSEVLWFKGYSSVDHILATHADADHIQGLVDVAKNFTVGSALFGRVPTNDPEFAELNLVLARRGIPMEIVGRGDIFNVGQARAEVLYPFRTDDPDAASDNDHSVVLRIALGGRAFLLTGDIERAAEESLVSKGGTIAADLVKVPHHGSRTSSTAEFISVAHPQYAVISVGRHSPFGHPHPDVVERWQTAGVRVLTTGENGMISVSTDGKDLKIERYVPD